MGRKRTLPFVLGEDFIHLRLSCRHEYLPVLVKIFLAGRADARVRNQRDTRSRSDDFIHPLQFRA